MAKMQADKWWQGVLTRDSKLDGKVYYAVKSTGVFCRPSCPSRRPSKSNIEFFATPEAARANGYRDCKRCRPADQIDPKVAFVGKIVEYLDQSFDNTHTLESLSKRFGMSPFHLQRSFKSVVGVTPKGYIDALRMVKLKEQLQSGHQVSFALYEAGFGASSRLYEKSSSKLGMTPATYGRKGKGAKIAYGIFQSAFGMVLIAATSLGVCFLQFGKSTSALRKQLQEEFAQAELFQNDQALEPWFEELEDYLTGKRRNLELPVEVHGTAFQLSVWQHLRSLPVGQTQTYGAIAEALGHPRGARAVARACASNRIAIAIPCHRVIREDGNLGGYRWGLSKKQILLEQEKKM